VPNYPAEGDDRWQVHALNRYYGASFPTSIPATSGKIMGWTDWTHGQ
jgi:hypothetical protein